MSRPPLKSETALAVCFLVIIFAVPIGQVCMQLSRGERAQFTDLFRYAPTEVNLRQFEDTLKEQSWFEQRLRPLMQQFLLRAVRDTGSKAIMGRDGWLFYRPDARYVVEPDRPDSNDQGKWVQPPSGTRQDSVVRAIMRFRDQLKERGIELLVLPLPGKPSIYPDMLWRTDAARGEGVYSPTLEFILKLQMQGVKTVDLFTGFSRVRDENRSGSLYLARDTHWTPVGARLAAQAVARELHSLGWAPRPTRRFHTKNVRVRRYGDILEMLQDHGERNLVGEVVECEQVVDEAAGLIMSSDMERPGTFRYPGEPASILILGDSFLRIFQNREPQSLGEIVRNTDDPVLESGGDEKTNGRLLPGSAGFLSHLAISLSAPVDFIVSDGGAATDVRRSLSTNPEILEGKKVVIWEFVERDIQLGQAGWLDVPLPPLSVAYNHLGRVN